MMEDEQSGEMARAGVVATRLLADITPFADEMLAYLAERIPEAVVDDERGELLGLGLFGQRTPSGAIAEASAASLVAR